MVSHDVDENTLKCKKKAPNGVQLSNNFTPHKTKNPMRSKPESSITNSGKSAVSTTRHDRNLETSDSHEQCSNGAVYLPVENKSDPKVNSNSFTIEKPSVSGSTTWVSKLSRKSERKHYRSKLKLYKTVIKILINARSRDLWDYNIIQNALKFLSENRDQGSNDRRAATKNNTKNANLGNRRPETGVEISGAQTNARESMKLNETSADNVFEKNVTASTSKHFENECSRIENFDVESTDRITSVKEDRGTDSEATIHTSQKPKIIKERRNSSTKIADKKVRENGTARRTRDPYEFSDSDVVIEEIVSGTTMTSGSSRKRHENLRGVELEEINVSNVNKGRKLSPKIGCPEGALKNLRKRNSKKVKKVSEDSESSSLKNKKAEKRSKMEGGDLNQAKTDVRTKTTGRYCSCKPKKLMNVKTSAYAIPAQIECPSLIIRSGYGSRSTGLKSAQGSQKIEKKSPVGEKKTKKFYSALELEYSDAMKSKLDPKHDSRNLNNSLKTDKVTLNKSVNKVSKALKKFSLSNFTLPPKISRNDRLDSEIDKKNSSSSKLPTFSKYSIPVSIEINMVKNKFQKRSSSSNLIQSKITRYFLPTRVPERKNVIEKFSDLNSALECDKNGNKLGRNNSKNESHSVPVIESDITLKDTERIIYLKNNTNLRFSARDYLYNVINENSELLRETTGSNRNVTLPEKINRINGKDRSVDIIDDSNTSAGASIVPPSYSIFSYEDENKKPIIDINQILDTQQREDFLTPWESVNIYEKINRWHDDAFEP